MAKGKLILICQSGGEFVKNDNGSLTYNGGEAQAVTVTSDTQFDDLKLKLAELCNLDYKTVSIKYFLPGNTQTLITLSNDKDLRRMLDFHGNSVTSDVYVMGEKGFNPDALSTHINRESGIKVAEPVNQVAPAAPARAAHRKTTARRKKATRAVTNSAKGVGSTPKKRTRVKAALDSSASADSDDSPVTSAAHASADSPIEMDMCATPADTVKKRRRAASKKVANKKSQKRNRQISVADSGSERKKVARSIINTENMTPEELIASWKDGITGVGQDFENVQEFREALQKFAIAHRFVYKLKKNDSSRASAKCVTEGCPWRIYASWVPEDEVFRIKTFDDSHTCEGESWKSAHPSKKWLVNIIKDRLRDSPNHKPKEIANGIMQDFGIELNYTQVWRGFGRAKEQLQGSCKQAYNRLSWYCEKIMETNPGSFAKLETGDENRFRCLFISFRASIHGFQNGCRPLLFLEATSLKSKYQEVLLTATSLDGNDGFFPVAFAIVDNENDENWYWFLEQLRTALPTSGSITFVFDREKKLKESVLKVFQNAYIGYTIFHLLDSFKRSLKGPFHGDGKGSLPGYLVAAAQAARPVSFKKFMEQIKKVTPQAYDWVMQIEPECWTAISCKGERHSQITEDVAALYSKLMEEVKESFITQKIDALIRMMMELITTRQVESNQWSTKLIPSKTDILRDEIIGACDLKVLISTDTIFEVRDDAIHVVNLSNRECTCLRWQTSGLPCRHAIAVFNCTSRSVYEYCSRYFMVDSFRLTYAESISPLPDTSNLAAGEADDDSDTEPVLPPSLTRSSSEPKAKRPKIRKPTRWVVCCSRCKEAGHNKKSCKAPMPLEVPLEVV